MRLAAPYPLNAAGRINSSRPTAGPMQGIGVDLRAELAAHPREDLSHRRTVGHDRADVPNGATRQGTWRPARASSCDHASPDTTDATARTSRRDPPISPGRRRPDLMDAARGAVAARTEGEPAGFTGSAAGQVGRHGPFAEPGRASGPICRTYRPGTAWPAPLGPTHPGEALTARHGGTDSGRRTRRREGRHAVPRGHAAAARSAPGCQGCFTLDSMWSSIESNATSNGLTSRWI
jgi:hypothetical protein